MKSINDLIRKYTYASATPRSVGLDSQILIKRYVDLMSAMHDEGDAALLIDHLCDAVKSISESVTLVASPKVGNALLGWRVAQQLNLRSCFVKMNVLFNRWIEGEVGNGDQVAIIDDVGTDSEIISHAVTQIRASGGIVSVVLLVVNRVEGDVAEWCESHGIPFQALLQLSDADLPC